MGLFTDEPIHFFTSDTDICGLVSADTDPIQKNHAELTLMFASVKTQA